MATNGEDAVTVAATMAEATALVKDLQHEGVLEGHNFVHHTM